MDKSTILSLIALILYFLIPQHSLGQERDSSIEKRRIDIDGGTFLDYYDELYTPGFAWLIEERLFVGKEEWTDGFREYVLYIDTTEAPVQSDSLLDQAGNRLEILEIDRRDRANYNILRAWRQVKGEEKIELEILLTREAFEDTAYQEIDTKRELWQKLSNKHKPETLVNRTYAPESYYVNGGRVVQGWGPIVESYAYMNQPNWKISLTPKKVVQVDEATILEIGTYTSNGQGNYVLLWKKFPDLGWRIMLDFNF